MPKVNSKSDAELFADLDAAVAWAKSQGGDDNRLGVMGFCRGGRNVWHYSAHNPKLKAGVAFYGPLGDKSEAAPKSSIELAPEIKEPVLGLYGEADTGISVDQVHQMEAALKAGGKTSEFHIYPGAPHGFVADYRRELSQRSGRGCLESHGRLVQEVQGAELIHCAEARGAFRRRVFACGQ